MPSVITTLRGYSDTSDTSDITLKFWLGIDHGKTVYVTFVSVICFALIEFNITRRRRCKKMYKERVMGRVFPFG
jgi:hypothetical protein